ncbi:TRAP transporter small permease subunit [Billgrantia diversa]|uniref:TRAP transporter small permease n=1 Tax=Halomonas sp. MCCC 1A13316 TaxID=2733487 RepID=UPI0018A35714|nr:TRAP transporter small permease subunit [Halomonas sp. MCCC 1A13316]QOR37747.1 TRAP transporter small permease subunit [Halomonas sp. MCCC 1A13316]
MSSLLSVFHLWVSRLINAVAIITSVVLVGMVFFMVISRYVFNWSIIGMDEIALISAMWLYMSGAVIASRRSEHLVVDFLPQRISSPALLKIHQRLIAMIMLLTSGFFVFLAWKLLGFSLRLPQYTPGLKLPELIAKSAVMLASVGCFLYALRDLLTGKTCHNPQEEE